MRQTGYIGASAAAIRQHYDIGNGVEQEPIREASGESNRPCQILKGLTGVIRESQTIRSEKHVDGNSRGRAQQRNSRRKLVWVTASTWKYTPPFIPRPDLDA